MANVVITEGAGIAQQAGDQAAQCLGDIVTSQPVAIGASSAQSAAFNDRTRLIRVFSPSKCTVAVGANPTATADAQAPMAAESELYFTVRPGHKLAVIERA